MAGGSWATAPLWSRLGCARRAWLRQGAEDGALDHGLSDVHFECVHAHGARHGADSGGGLLDGGLDVLALELILDDSGAVGDGSDSAQHDAAVGPDVVRNLERGGNRDDGEVVDFAVL